MTAADGDAEYSICAMLTSEPAAARSHAAR